MTLKCYNTLVCKYKETSPFKARISVFKKWGDTNYLSREWKERENFYLLSCTVMSFGPSSMKVHYKHKYQNVKSVIIIPYNQIVQIRTWGI